MGRRRMRRRKIQMVVLKEINYKEKIEEAKFILQNNIEWIKNCDEKASIVLALVGVILTITLTSDCTKTFIEIIKANIKRMLSWDSIFLVAIVINLLVILFGIKFLYSALKAKLDYNSFKLDGLAKSSVIYFGTIEKHDEYMKYKSFVLNISDEEYLNDLYSQIYINSKIAKEKFYNYNKGISIITIGTFVLLILILFVVGYYFYKGF